MDGAAGPDFDLSAASSTRSSGHPLSPRAISSSFEEYRPRTHLQNNVRQLEIHTDGTIPYLATQHILAATRVPKVMELASLTVALAHPHWKRAMEEEYYALI